MSRTSYSDHGRPVHRILFQFLIASLLSVLALLCSALFSAGSASALDLRVSAQGQPEIAQDQLVHMTQRHRIRIHDQVAAQDIDLQLRNALSQEVEVSARFALARDQKVDGFSYYNGAEKIVGEVLEKQAARQVYEELTGMQRDPGIVEQEGNFFRFSIFPVAPGEVKPVQLRTVASLTTHKDWVTLRIPQENLPRDPRAVVSLDLEVSDDVPIRQLEVQGLQAVVERRSDRLLAIRHETLREDIEGDIRIRYQLQIEDHALRVISHRVGQADGSFMLRLSPRPGLQVDDGIGRDVVLVTDISGSMGGDPLTESKEGLLSIVSQLSERDRFEVVAFDDQSYPLFGKLEAVNRASRRRARAQIDSLEVRGGTNIHGALIRAVELLDASKAPARGQAIIFLTDGMGSTPPDVITADLRQRAPEIRIFPFGAGKGVNRAFLQRLAEENRGVATFVDEEHSIGEAMRSLYERIAMPVLVDLELETRGLQVHSIFPERLPDLYRDSEVIVFGRYSQPGEGSIALKGKLRDQEVRYDLKVEFLDAQPAHPYIEKLWASRRIDQLMGKQLSHGQQPELEKEITRLGIVYNLVTPYTTFLAVPESLKTEAIKEQIRQGQRGYDRKLIESMESIQLSQKHIPPGDPVLSVEAPEDALRVTAFFPFSLVKPLRWDPIREHWSVRFLVPLDVKDGIYAVRVKILHADGSLEWKTIDYEIDGSAPEFELQAEQVVDVGGDLEIEVDAFEPARRVRAWLVGQPEVGVKLRLDLETGLYRARLHVPFQVEEGEHTLRVEVMDRARNRHTRDLTVTVMPLCMH